MFWIKSKAFRLHHWIVQQKARGDAFARCKARAHDGQLQWACEIIPLANGSIDRIKRLPFTPELIEFPIRSRHCAVELASDGEVKLLSHSQFLGERCHFVEADLLSEMVEIAIAALCDRPVHIHHAMIRVAVEETAPDTPAAAADNRVLWRNSGLEKRQAVHRLNR